MVTKIIKYYIILLVIFFYSANFASANVIINEVKLSPTEERFIELYNSGDSSVNLTDWYIQRKTASGSDFGSLVSKTNFEGKSINADGYFLISRTEMSNTDIVVDNLTLTESNTIQIKNSEGSVIDKVGWGDAVIPNPTDGKSIQKLSSGDWVISTHTPRALNSESGGSDENSNNEEENNNDENSGADTTSSTPTSNSNKGEEPEILKITTKIISPKIVTAGIPFSLSSLTTTNRGKTYAIGRYLWNFGDGMVSEVGKSDPFDYIYEYPGEYVLILSYFNSVFSRTADATNRITIKVIPFEIFISSVGSGVDPFIEIENKSNYEIILSNWVVTAGIHYFKIPEGTTLLPNKKIKFSPKITGFVGEDIKSIVVTNGSKEIVATYPTEIKKPIQKNTSVSAIAQKSVSAVETNSQDDPLPKDSQVINLNDLAASAGESGINIPKSVYVWGGLLVIIGLGITSFLMIKRRKSYDDYVDKEIRAEDMTIIE